MIHTPSAAQPSVTARAKHTWNGLSTGVRALIVGTCAAALVGAGYAAGTMQTPTPSLSITIFDSATGQERDINMCAAVRSAVSEVTAMPELPDAARAQFKRAVEARCP